MYTRFSFLSSTLATASLGACLLASTPALADVPADPPRASIVSPEEGATFDGPTATIDITTEVTLESQLDSVILRIDDEDVATVSAAPWDFSDVVLDEGMHNLVTVAVAKDSTQALSLGVNVIVFAEAGSESSSGDSSGSDSSSGDSSSGDSGDSGGGCAVDSNLRLGGSGALVLFGLFCLGLAQRRREA